MCSPESILEVANTIGKLLHAFMKLLGVGENEQQILDTLRGKALYVSCLIPTNAEHRFFFLELRKVDVDVVTFGQYMRPTKRHMKVDRYVEPAEFDRWKAIAEDMGFLYVASGPLVRSSYKVDSFVLVF